MKDIVCIFCVPHSPAQLSNLALLHFLHCLLLRPLHHRSSLRHHLHRLHHLHHLQVPLRVSAYCHCCKFQLLCSPFNNFEWYVCVSMRVHFFRIHTAYPFPCDPVDPCTDDSNFSTLGGFACTEPSVNVCTFDENALSSCGVTAPLSLSQFFRMI